MISCQCLDRVLFLSSFYIFTIAFYLSLSLLSASVSSSCLDGEDIREIRVWGVPPFSFHPSFKNPHYRQAYSRLHLSCHFEVITHSVISDRVRIVHCFQCIDKISWVLWPWRASNILWPWRASNILNGRNVTAVLQKILSGSTSTLYCVSYQKNTYRLFSQNICARDSLVPARICNSNSSLPVTIIHYPITLFPEPLLEQCWGVVNYM